MDSLVHQTTVVLSACKDPGLADGTSEVLDARHFDNVDNSQGFEGVCVHCSFKCNRKVPWLRLSQESQYSIPNSCLQASWRKS